MARDKSLQIYALLVRLYLVCTDFIKRTKHLYEKLPICVHLQNWATIIKYLVFFFPQLFNEEIIVRGKYIEIVL